jgi:hypothetical protein
VRAPLRILSFRAEGTACGSLRRALSTTQHHLTRRSAGGRLDHIVIEFAAYVDAVRRVGGTFN